MTAPVTHNITRQQVADAIKMLGLDPEYVTSIHMEGRQVTVEVLARDAAGDLILDAREERHVTNVITYRVTSSHARPERETTTTKETA